MKVSPLGLLARRRTPAGPRRCREVERVGAVVAAFEREAVALEDVEDRDLALVLDVGVAARDRGLVERDGGEPSTWSWDRLGRLEHGRPHAFAVAAPRRMATERRCASSPSARASVMAAGASACERARVELQDRGALHEVEHAEARGEAGAARRRQHVVGARHVVADHLRRVRAEEDGAGIADARGERFRVARRDLEVLGGDAVGERGRLVERARAR